ncbi:MAG: carbamoyl-phosphate-synthetase [Ruminococcus sp.]|nr:carbamoyl-phosphate-synthetase [Ruminococcus sp.]
MDLKGKKLLILGGTNIDIEVINEARKMGVYTIATDNHTDRALSPAKAVADEAYDISWTDYDALEKLCREKHIDGCLAGFSETRIKILTEICRRMGFYCYTDGADLESICNKNNFRDFCIENGIPVPRHYNRSDEIESFPVIVKPVDNAGSRGIRLCRSKEEMLAAFEASSRLSTNGDAVIEEFLDGDEPQYEPAFFYVIKDGVARLENSLDRVMVNFGDDIIKQAVANVYPSKYLDTFLKEQDGQFRQLFSKLGMKNGIVFMQGKMKNGSFYPVDIGYRLEGSLSFHYSEHINGVNPVQMMIRYALTGSMCDEDIFGRSTARYDKTGVTVTLLATKGKIAKIEGIDEISREKCVIHVSQRLRVGAECRLLADFSQVFSRIYLCSDDRQELIRTIDKIYDTVKVLNENGNNMLIGRYDADELK